MDYNLDSYSTASTIFASEEFWLEQQASQSKI